MVENRTETGTDVAVAEGDQAAVIAFLQRPENFAELGQIGLRAVETIETHASIIFLAGDRAYKLKRAITYSYLDYSTVAMREQACRTELVLNRRTAPNLYLDVISVRKKLDGSLAFTGNGEPRDWLVVMQRFPQECLFTNLADKHELTDAHFLQLADRIASFHQAAEMRPDQGGAAGIAAVIAINDQNLRQMLADSECLQQIDALKKATSDAFNTLRDLLEVRRFDGHVRQCHGDLHLGNICLLDGMPTMFDCIEFNPLISCTDTLYDLAFLIMDLRFRGLAHDASRIFNRYMDLSADEAGLPLMPLFLSLRAAVRAHVTAATLSTSHIDPQVTRAKAKAYLDLACRELTPAQPRLVAIGGFSGTGKSSIAALVASTFSGAPCARVLRSDVIRKRLFKRAPEERLPVDSYRAEVTDRVYRALLEIAEAALISGHSVVIDAVAARPAERAAMRALATRLHIPFHGIWLTAEPNVLRRRIAARRRDASDATPSVLEQQLSFDIGEMDWQRVDADGSLASVVSAVEMCLSE